jgi:general secretion pathway protein G
MDCKQEVEPMNRLRVFQALSARRAARTAGRAQRGMTLLEIMIVLAILTLIMGIVVGPRVFEMFSKSKIDLAKTEMKQLVYEAYTRWEVDNVSRSGSCPQAISELTAYANKKDGKDPWGNEYVMHCGDSAAAGARFGLSSNGPDGKQGTDDDLRTWEF